MADIGSVLEIQNNTALEQEVDISCGALGDKVSQPTQVMAEGEDSVFYSEEEDVPQHNIDSIWAPCSGEPIWPEKLNSAPQVHSSGAHSSCHSIGLMEASMEHDSTAVLKEMESKMENIVNNVSDVHDDVHGETANSRITHTEELSTPPVVPLRSSTPAETAQMKEAADKYPDESSSYLSDGARDTGPPGEGSVSLEEEVDEYGLDMSCEAKNKQFDHLTHAKYGTVSYRRIRRGQTRKRIEMFESMMPL